MIARLLLGMYESFSFLTYANPTLSPLIPLGVTDDARVIVFDQALVNEGGLKTFARLSYEPRGIEFRTV